MTHLSKNFLNDEFACPCCGYNSINLRLMPIAEIIRHENGDEPITPNSACRCSLHNEEVGGKDNSWHLSGDALDMPCKSPSLVAIKLDNLFPDMFGIGVYEDDGFIHVDMRHKRTRW